MKQPHPQNAENLATLFDNYETRREKFEWPSEPNIADLYHRLEEDADLFSDSARREQPKASIVTPIYLPTEPPEMTVTTLRAVQRSAQQFGPVEILLWGNYTAPDPDTPHLETDEEYALFEKKHQQAETESATKLYEIVDCIKEARDLDFDLLRIRPALSWIMSDQNMNHVRGDVMDVLSFDAVRRKFDPNHKVFWLDNDLTFMNKSALTDMGNALDRNPGKIAKPHVLFTGEPGQSTVLSELDEITRAAAAYAILRRMAEHGVPYRKNSTYLDECGLGMRLSDWLSWGGLVERPGNAHILGHNESQALLRNAIEYEIKMGSTDVPDHVVSVPTARIGTSYRKMRKVVGLSEARRLVPTLQSNTYRPYALGEAIEQPHINIKIKRFMAKYVSEEAVRNMARDLALYHDLKGAFIGDGQSPEAIERAQRFNRLAEILIQRCGFTYESEAVAEKANADFRQELMNG